MKTSTIIIGLLIVAAGGTGAYFYINSPSRKRKWLIQYMAQSGDGQHAGVFDKMTDDEIKISYKLVKATANNEKPNFSTTERSQLQLISSKYNIFT